MICTIIVQNKTKLMVSLILSFIVVHYVLSMPYFTVIIHNTDSNSIDQVLQRFTLEFIATWRYTAELTYNNRVSIVYK